MKYLAAIILTGALATTSASAQILFAPDFSTGTTPSGYTEFTSTSPTGTITYNAGADQMVNGDASANSTYAYIKDSGAIPLSNSITSQITFTPTYNYLGASGQAGYSLFYLASANGNNPLLNVSLNVSGYTNSASVILQSGLQFSGGTTTGTTTYTSPGGGSLSGLSLTLNDVETFTNTGGLNWTITNNATLYNGSTLLQTFNYTTSGASENSSYDPVNNPLTLDVGIYQGQFGGGAESDPGVIDTTAGATLAVSGVSVIVSVPEPSPYVLLGLGLMGMFLVSRMRRRSVLRGQAQ